MQSVQTQVRTILSSWKENHYLNSLFFLFIKNRAFCQIKTSALIG
jgi:hypothetical protein